MVSCLVVRLPVNIIKSCVVSCSGLRSAVPAIARAALAVSSSPPTACRKPQVPGAVSVSAPPSAYCHHLFRILRFGQHSPWPFLCAVHPRPAARSFLFPVPVAGRHLVVSGLWPSVLLECCIWQRYVLIFISQCHCEHLFHRLPWDFFYCLQSCAVAVAVSRCLPVCFSCFSPSVLQPRLLLSVAVHGFHAAPSVFCLHALCRLLFRCFGKFDGVCLRILMLFRNFAMLL